MMNNDLLITLLLLGACIIMFALNRPRMDVVALLMLVALPLTGIVTIDEALAGFSDSNVILIAGLFVVGEGLVRTGLAYQVGDLLVKKSGSHEVRLMIFVMVTVALLGSIMSSTGIVAIFLPIILNVCNRMGIHPGRMMMPLSFAGLVSGMMTLVGTPPNLILDGAVKNAGEPGFGFFSFTPIGMLVLTVGVLYMLAMRRHLARGAGEQDKAGSRRRSMVNMVNDYQLKDRGCSLRVPEGSPMAGHTLEDLCLRSRFEANVVAILRHRHFKLNLLAPRPQTEVQVGDTLLVDVIDPAANLPRLSDEMKVEVLKLRGNYFENRTREVGMAEVIIPPESRLVGKSIRSDSFRNRHFLNVVGLRRNGVPVGNDYLSTKLKVGDTLLVVGPWNSIRRLQSRHHDYIVLSLPVEFETAAPAASRDRLAIVALIVMIVLMVSGVVPNVIAVLIACLLMGLFRCLDMASAYRAIHWPSLIVIVGMMPFAIALERTGGLHLAVNSIMSIESIAGNPRLLLACVFVITALFNLFISNTATAVLMAPLAMSIAAESGLSVRPFAMAVALAASAAFITPVSSPVNMLVMAPGEYRFMDFVKIGLPFTIIVLVITVLLVPVLFPF